MIVAVSCSGLNVAPYFTQTSSFMVYTVERGIIVDSRNLPAIGETTKELIDLLRAIDADTLIAGRIECDLCGLLCRGGIEVIADAEGEALEVMKAYLTETLTGVIDACFLCDEEDWESEQNEVAQPAPVLD